MTKPDLVDAAAERTAVEESEAKADKLIEQARMLVLVRDSGDRAMADNLYSEIRTLCLSRGAAILARNTYAGEGCALRARIEELEGRPTGQVYSELVADLRDERERLAALEKLVRRAVDERIDDQWLRNARKTLAAAEESCKT